MPSLNTVFHLFFTRCTLIRESITPAHQAILETHFVVNTKDIIHICIISPIDVVVKLAFAVVEV